MPGPVWAKALGPAEESLLETTRRDRQEFLSAGLAPVQCSACRTRVLVRKTSARHTSVQWTTDAATSCAEYAARLRAAGGSSALLDTCEQLRKSIDQAVADGGLEVPDG